MTQISTDLGNFPTHVLSETRGLLLSWIVREGNRVDSETRVLEARGPRDSPDPDRPDPNREL